MNNKIEEGAVFIGRESRRICSGCRRDPELVIDVRLVKDRQVFYIGSPLGLALNASDYSISI